jgi:diadenosine tetraphosphate (Ap4A) HIT family hydrolase
VEHAFPCGIKGWLVIVLKRHAEGLHELSEAEFLELGAIQYRAAQVLKRLRDCDREYSICFHEAPNFNHIHFHTIARAKDLPQPLRGVGVFALLKGDPTTMLAPQEIIQFSQELSQYF